MREHVAFLNLGVLPASPAVGPGGTGWTNRPDVEFRYLVSFLAIADELHFGRAAARLHLAQPSLSQQLQRLEREVGVQLVNRTSHAVRLTPAGEAFRAEAPARRAQVGAGARAARTVVRALPARPEPGPARRDHPRGGPRRRVGLHPVWRAGDGSPVLEAFLDSLAASGPFSSAA